MTKNTKVTLGIPFYNAERYLAYSIQSIINQTNNDWELLLVNDGSTDDSLKIAQSYTDSRIRIIDDRKNKGISYRLNQIIQEAKGEYIARMDADDIAFPNRIEKQVKVLEANPELDLVDSEAVIINEKSEITGYRKIKDNFNTLPKILEQIRFIHPTVMFRKSFIEKFKYNSLFDGAEDLDLWLRSFNRLKAGKLEIPLYFYREQSRLNLRTYLFRTSKLSILYKNYKNSIPGIYYIKLTGILQLKRIIYRVAWHLHLDSYLLSLRNTPVSKDQQAFYYQQLNNSISGE